MFILRLTAVGAGIGALFGAGLLGAGAAAGGGAWAGMLLLAGVLSFPAGLWVFDAFARLPAGVLDPASAATLVGPTVNFATLFLITAIVIRIVRLRTSAL